MQHELKDMSWTYALVDAPNFDELRQELSRKEFIDIVKRNTPDSALSDFVVLNRDELEKYVPKTIEFINSIGLSKDRWFMAAFIITRPGFKTSVHVDSAINPNAYYALNFPLINTDDTHTVFYEVKDDISHIQEMGIHGANYGVYTDDQIVREIARVQSNKPYWVNIRCPHRPEFSHNKERIMCSFRFKPEPHEWFDEHYPNLKK
jgi:hypothetical protein